MFIETLLQEIALVSVCVCVTQFDNIHIFTVYLYASELIAHDGHTCASTIMPHRWDVDQ